MERAGVEEGVIVGLSLGGYVAIEMASRHPKHAARIRPSHPCTRTGTEPPGPAEGVGRPVDRPVEPGPRPGMLREHADLASRRGPALEHQTAGTDRPWLLAAAASPATPPVREGSPVPLGFRQQRPHHRRRGRPVHNHRPESLEPAPVAAIQELEVRHQARRRTSGRGSRPATGGCDPASTCDSRIGY